MGASALDWRKMSMRIGVDLGGTKIETLALDRDGVARAGLRRATPREDYPATLAAIAQMVAETEQLAGTGLSPVGVGMPGAISPATGLVKNANSTWLIGRRFRQDLARVLGRPLRLANDADCFAISEATDGAAAGTAIVFGVILGTGVGGGIVVDGRLLAGANAIAGEWGHNPLPSPTDDERPGPACYCGRRGCIETWLSGPALARDHAARTGQRLEAAGIVAAAAAGNPGAEASLGRYEDRLGRALAHVINILDPHAIVLGGGMSKIARLYRHLPALVARHVFSDTVATRILAPRHGDASGVRGAAWLWRPEEVDAASLSVDGQSG
jgi:fructokinase